MIVQFATLTTGAPAYGCHHMAGWWPRFTALLKANGIKPPGIFQARGNAAASAGTHDDGTALDLATIDPKVSVLAREGGAPAAWPRTVAQGFDTAHTHLVLDCTCTKAALYQITAVKAGFNGLGVNGRGGPDYIPKPSQWRNVTDGLIWIDTQLGDDMAFTPEQEKNIAEVAGIANYKRPGEAENSWQKMYVASIQANQKADALTAKVDALTALVETLAKGGLTTGTEFTAVVK